MSPEACTPCIMCKGCSNDDCRTHLSNKRIVDPKVRPEREYCQYCYGKQYWGFIGERQCWNDFIDRFWTKSNHAMFAKYFDDPESVWEDVYTVYLAWSLCFYRDSDSGSLVDKQIEPLFYSEVVRNQFQFILPPFYMTESEERFYADMAKRCVEFVEQNIRPYDIYSDKGITQLGTKLVEMILDSQQNNVRTFASDLTTDKDVEVLRVRKEFAGAIRANVVAETNDDEYTSDGWETVGRRRRRH